MIGQLVLHHVTAEKELDLELAAMLVITLIPMIRIIALVRQKFVMKFHAVSETFLL